jgi:tetratricopeptide (TPR) repeat protein
MARIFFLEQKNAAQAQELAEQSIAIFRAVGNRRLMAYSLNLLAQILSANHEDDRAESILEESLAILKAQGEHLGTAETHIILARIAAHRGDNQAAQAHYHQSRNLQPSTGDRELAAMLLEGYGNVLVAQGDVEKAVQLWGTAAATRLAIVAPMPPAYRADYRQAIAIARQHLDDESFREIWLQGSKTPLEQAMEIQF